MGEYPNFFKKPAERPVEKPIEEKPNLKEEKSQEGITRRDFLKGMAAMALTLIPKLGFGADDVKDEKEKKSPGKKKIFEIKSIIEQTPFKDPMVEEIFKIWCEANDSLEPRVISREEWNKIGNNILEKKSVGKQKLFIPEDLKLWEMVNIIEAVDKDTFADKPEKARENKEKIIKLGKTLKNSGIYIAQRLNSITEGKEIAEAMAKEFYEYGSSLVSGKKEESKKVDIRNIKLDNLTIEEVSLIDHFLAGDNLHASRIERAKKSAKEKGGKEDMAIAMEEERRKTLAQFFRAAERAFMLETKEQKGKLSRDKEDLKPWQEDTSAHAAFLKKIRTSMEKKIETPKTELTGTIFKRGMELLQKYMPFDKLEDELKKLKEKKDPSNIDKQNIGKLSDLVPTIKKWQELNYSTLREALRIDDLKAELAEIRKSGSPAEIGNKEYEIAEKIQKIVSSLPYQSMTSSPSKIKVDQYINCVGASVLGGAFLSEVGIKYIVSDVPNHSVLVLVTTDKKTRIMDMLNPLSNVLITDEMLGGTKEDGSMFTVDDIVNFSENPLSPSLTLEFVHGQVYFSWMKEGEYNFFKIMPPVIGQEIQVLWNLGYIFYDLKEYKKAIKIYQEIIKIDDQNADIYINLSPSFFQLKRYEEAIKASKKAIKINKKDILGYYNLGFVFYKLKKYKEAVEVFNEVIKINPKYERGYTMLASALEELGKKQEAEDVREKHRIIRNIHGAPDNTLAGWD